MSKIKNNLGIQGHPVMPNIESKDRIYKYLGGGAVVAWIPSKSNKRVPLLWFDEGSGTNFELRYARNQRSPLAQFQDSNAILEPIEFTDGQLLVSKTNPSLQLFLHLHPAKGRLFVEVDADAEAQEELEWIEIQDEARDLAKSICKDIDAAELLYTELYPGKTTAKMTSAMIIKDVRKYAENNPQKFMNIAEELNASTEIQIEQFVKNKLIQFRNDSKEVWFNLPNNKKKMMNVPQGEDPHKALAEFFDTEEGLEAVRKIESVQATL